MRFRHLTIAGAVVASSLALTLAFSGGASGASLPNTEIIPGACALDLSPNHSHCDLSLLATLKGTPRAAAAPTAGYGPADLRSAYALPSSGGSGQTVAIVDAFGDNTAEADMNAYRSNYGLPACTTASGCFKKVNQSGTQGSYPIEQPGLGSGDTARPRDGLGDLPWLQDPPGRGDLEHQRQPLRGRGHRGATGRQCDLQQLRRQRGEHRDQRRRPLQPPGRRDHSVVAATAGTASSTRPHRST